MVLVYHGFLISATQSGNRIDHTVTRVTNSGWAGVDLFFVLSGFLITGILLREADGIRGAGVFYARRFLRIVPVCAVFLLVLMYVLPLATPSLRDDAGILLLRENQAWYWTFTINVKVALEPLEGLGRFGNGHLWSLAVEEQFYLVWPALVLLLPRRALLPALGCCVVGALAFRFALHGGAWPRLDNVFAPLVLMPSRMDALGLGALVAVLVERDARIWERVRGAFICAAAGGLVVAVSLGAVYGQLWPGDRWTQIFGFSAIAVVFAAFVFWAASDAARGMRRHLSSEGLRFFGRYSYALYIVHYQVMVELDRRWDAFTIGGSDLAGRVVFTVFTTGIAIAIAWVSWRLIEQPCLSLKRFLPYRGEQAVPAVPLTADSQAL
jgi:peptidoglycan/LPS O-acetylase OafA/YrhL